MKILIASYMNIACIDLALEIANSSPKGILCFARLVLQVLSAG